MIIAKIATINNLLIAFLLIIIYNDSKEEGELLSLSSVYLFLLRGFGGRFFLYSSQDLVSFETAVAIPRITVTLASHSSKLFISYLLSIY